MPNDNSSSGEATRPGSTGRPDGADTLHTSSKASIASRAPISPVTGLVESDESTSDEGIDRGATGVGVFAAGAGAALRETSFPGATGATNGAAVGRWAVTGRMSGRLGADAAEGPANGRAPRRAKGVVVSSFF